MRNMMKKAAQNVKAVAVRAGMLMKDTKGENYVDTAVKILIAVVLGALLLAGLYALFGDVVMPTPYTEDSGHVQLRRIRNTGPKQGNRKNNRRIWRKTDA